MDISVNLTDAQAKLPQLVDEVCERTMRIGIHRYGRVVAVLVPMEDDEYLERADELQDQRDLAIIKKRGRGGNPSPWEEVKKRLGI